MLNKGELYEKENIDQFDTVLWNSLNIFTKNFYEYGTNNKYNNFFYFYIYKCINYRILL